MQQHFHMLMRHTLQKFTKNLIVQKNSALALFLALISIGFLPSGDLTAARMQDITTNNVVTLINMERSAVGIQHLTHNDTLAIAAQAKLNDMFAHKYFAHTSPQHVTPWYWFGEVSYDYAFAGENLAMQFRDVHAQHGAWMKSTTHRQNILNPRYQETGIAVGRGLIDGKMTTVTVQLFGTPQGTYVAMPSPVDTLNQHVAFVPATVPRVAGAHIAQSQTVPQWMAVPNETTGAWVAIAVITLVSIIVEIKLVTRLVRTQHAHVQTASLNL